MPQFTFFNGSSAAASLLAVVALFAAGVGHADHVVSGEKSHGDWQSMLIETPKGHVGRAMTVHTDRFGNMSTLNLDSPAADCGALIMSVNINLSEVEGVPLEDPVLFGKYRVDGNPVHDINYAYTLEKGPDYVRLIFPARPRADVSMDEIMNGKVIRFQFKISGEARYFQFTLNGSSGALNRQERLCTNELQADELYIKQAVPELESYFRD